MKQPARHRLLENIGLEVVRFQEESTAFDDVAARILALDRADLPCMTMLLSAAGASVDQLTAALQEQERRDRHRRRLQLADMRAARR